MAQRLKYCKTVAERAVGVEQEVERLRQIPGPPLVILIECGLVSAFLEQADGDAAWWGNDWKRGRSRHTQKMKHEETV